MSRNERIVAALLRAEEESRLHHAYLLAGAESGQKKKVVAEVAARLSSRPDAADRIARGVHPDVHLLKAEEGLLSVDEVRTLPKILAYPPLESRRRVVMVEDAAAMNPQAANALLKILEEPPAHSMFFLFCREPSDLLQTIVSRCQVLRFAPLPDAEVQTLLGGEADSSLLALAEGSLARAEAVRDTEGGRAIAAAASDRILELWEASPRIPASVFAWAETLEGEAAVAIALDSWLLALRDLAFVAGGAPAGGLRDPARFARLKALASAREEGVASDVAQRAAAINRFRVYRRLNGNLRLDMASLVAELQIFPAAKSLTR